MVRHRFLLQVAFLCGSCAGVLSHASSRDAEPQEPDSSIGRQAPSYALDEVVITSSRIPSTVRRSPASVSLISRADIDRSGAIALSDILVAGPGLFIKDYGISSGLKTISQRGLGTEHTLVLLNGMPINSIQNGSIDFGAIPSEEIERVELVRGGQSASFGANAVAGVINIVTRSTGGEHLSVRFGAGSFGEREISAAVSDGSEALRWRMSGGVEKLDGAFPFQFDNGPASYALTRTNARSNARRLSGTVSAALSSSLRLQTTGLFLESDRGVPGIVMGPFPSSRASQSDQQGIVQMGLLQTVSTRSWWELKLQGLYGYQRYADPDIVIGGIPIDNSFRNTEGRAEFQIHADALEFGRYTVGGDLFHATANGNTVSTSPERNGMGFFIAGELRANLAADSSAILCLYPAIRYDRVKDVGDAASPQLGIQTLLLPLEPDGLRRHLLRIHGTIGRNFRTPTFNELFYSGGGGTGNPHLSPEHSTSYDLGVGITLPWMGVHELDLTGFSVDMQERIVWTSAGAGTTTPKNLRNVLARGIEATYLWAWPTAGTSLSIAYARSSSVKTSPDFPGDPNVQTQLPYAPPELFSCSAAWDRDVAIGPLRNCGISVTWSRVGFRYTTEDNASYLPAYTVVNGGCSARLECCGARLSLRADIRNALNESYMVMLGYPMPPISYRFSLILAY